MYPIVKKEKLADKIYLMDVKAPRVAQYCEPGQFVIVKIDEQGERIPLTICDYNREAGTITIVKDETAESGTNKHLATIAANCIDKLAVGDKVKAVDTEFYACPIVVVDTEDPNEDPDADGVDVSEAALTYYMKRDIIIENDRDILAKTTVITADKHYAAVLSNESKVVLAKFKA